MKLTSSQLRRIINEEIQRLVENDDEQAGASDLSDMQKKKLQKLSQSPPSSLGGFAMAMKELGAILGDVDEKAANLNSQQLGQYFTQIMKIVGGMMSEKKTSSSETAKVSKALDG